jgi:hypothetical protein
VAYDPPDPGLRRFMARFHYRLAYASSAGRIWIGPGP